MLFSSDEEILIRVSDGGVFFGGYMPDVYDQFLTEAVFVHNILSYYALKALYV